MPPTHSLNFVRHAFRQQIWPSIIIDNTCFTLQVLARSKILHRDAFSELRVILTELVYIIAWFVVIFAINTTSDISKLLCVISGAVRRVKFETILKYHKWYLCQISRTNHAIICLYYYQQKVCNFHMQVFQIKLKYHCSKPINLLQVAEISYEVVL